MVFCCRPCSLLFSVVKFLTKMCFSDFQKCIWKKGEGYKPCDWFRHHYEHVCPQPWIEKWSDQLDRGEKYKIPPLGNTKQHPSLILANLSRPLSNGAEIVTRDCVFVVQTSTFHRIRPART